LSHLCLSLDLPQPLNLLELLRRERDNHIPGQQSDVRCAIHAREMPCVL
jgi:hypothetical protein